MLGVCWGGRGGVMHHQICKQCGVIAVVGQGGGVCIDVRGCTCIWRGKHWGMRVECRD